MPWLRSVLPVVAVILVACGPATSPSTPGVPSISPPKAASATPSASAAASASELTSGSGPLPAGKYTRAAFRPAIVFAVDAGWTVGTVTDGFFDVQQDMGTPDVIAVQFADVDGVAGSGGSIVPATRAADAVSAIRENAGLVVVEESTSRMSGLEGLNVVVENRGNAPAPVMRVSPGTLSFDPGRKLWIALFDTADGLVAVMVGGSTANWDRTLLVAEPVLESVVIGGSAAASPTK